MERSCNNSISVVFCCAFYVTRTSQWFILHKRHVYGSMCLFGSFTEWRERKKKNKNEKTNKSPLAKHWGNVCVVLSWGEHCTAYCKWNWIGREKRKTPRVVLWRDISDYSLSNIPSHRIWWQSDCKKNNFMELVSEMNGHKTVCELRAYSWTWLLYMLLNLTQRNAALMQQQTHSENKQTDKNVT